MPPPEYEERVATAPMREERDTTTQAEVSRPYGEIGYQYRRGEEDGALAHIPYGSGVSRGELPSQEGEVERINGERRRRMKAGGFANWTLRKKEGKGEAIVR